MVIMMSKNEILKRQKETNVKLFATGLTEKAKSLCWELERILGDVKA